jgi:cytochrome c556
MKRILAVTIMALIAAGSTSALAQVKKGKTRPLLTKQLMKGLNQTNCAAIGDALKADSLDEKAWDALAIKAALLNEASYILMEDGRCPDGNWAKAATTLREQSAALLDTIAAKDKPAAQAAFKAMTQACAACHKDHKK